MRQPAQFLRIAGAFSCAAASASYVADIVGHTRSTGSPSLLHLWQSQLHPVLFHVFLTFGPVLAAVSFWRATRMVEDQEPSRNVRLVTLLVQTCLAFLTSFDLLPSVALEAGFLFPSLLGVGYVLGQAALEFVVCLFDHNLQSWLLNPTKWCFIHLVTFACGAMGAEDIRQRRDLTEKNHALELLNTRLVEMKSIEAESTRLAERLHFSRELHDAVGHHLTALSLKMQLANRLSNDKARATVAEAYQLVRVLLCEIRMVVKDLRETDRTDLLAALQTITAHVGKPLIHLAVAEDLPYLDPNLAHTIFRCVQEITTNAIRHSEAKTLWLQITRHENNLFVCGRDNGHGAQTVQMGNGLRGMTERVEESGGTLCLQASPGSGFEINIRLPIDRTLGI